MFLVIHHISSAYICFKEAEVTEATTVFPKNILVIFITSIISIPNSKPEVCKYSPRPQYSLKIFKSLSTNGDRACDLREDNDLCALCTYHTSGKQIKKWKFNNLNR